MIATPSRLRFYFLAAAILLASRRPRKTKTMTEQIREMSARQRQALPRNLCEMAAWLILKLGTAGIFLILLSIVWWNAERRTDDMRDLVRTNVGAFQQVCAEISAQRTQSAASIERMKEVISNILSELRELRLSTSKQ